MPAFHGLVSPSTMFLSICVALMLSFASADLGAVADAINPTLLDGASLSANGTEVNGTSATAALLSFAVNLPPGFSISVFAAGIPNARSLALSGSNPIVYVSSSAGGVYGLWDSRGAGAADHVVQLLSGLADPNGIAWAGGSLFVATDSAFTRYDNVDADVLAGRAYSGSATVLLSGLPVVPDHSRHYIRIGPDGKLYTNVGSPFNDGYVGTYYSSNAGTITYASINRMNLDGSNFVPVAQGVRNAVGFDWHPVTGTLYFSNNGIDQLGDFLPDDCLNSVTGSLPQFYGYPNCHITGHGDSSLRTPAAYDITLDPSYPPTGITAGSAQHLAFCQANQHPPIQPLGAHVASLGVRFWKGGGFPAEYTNSAFIAEHGSSLTSKKIGYRVARVVLDSNGNAVDHQVFAQGFVPTASNTVLGRPVDVQQFTDNSLLVSDDFNGAVYRISYSAANAGGDVLAAGQSIGQSGNLTSASGQWLLLSQPDGNLVTYSAAKWNFYGPTSPAAVFSTGTSGQPNQPFTLRMQTDCNLVLYNSAGTPNKAANTYNAGVAPCRAQLRNDGTLAVLDANGALLSVNLAQPPSAYANGVMATGQTLTQGQRLYTPDGAAFLSLQADGNLVLYNTARFQLYGFVARAAMWASGKYTNKLPPTLVMQPDCNLVLYTSQGRQPNNAYFDTATYGQGSSCRLVVTSTNGGRIQVLNGAGTVVYSRP